MAEIQPFAGIQCRGAPAAQIFHPLFWVGRDGAHPAPRTAITVADVESGRWRVDPELAPAVAPRPGPPPVVVFGVVDFTVAAEAAFTCFAAAGMRRATSADESPPS